VFAGTGNALMSNAIFSNGSLGIDLGGEGVTLNDLGDSDAGPNDLQNFPVVTSVTQVALGNTLLTAIQGTLNSEAATAFRLEVFANNLCWGVDPNNYGEGEQFVGSTEVTTDSSGNATFAITVPRVPTGDFITATATNLRSNNTSEFSQCFQIIVPQ